MRSFKRWLARSLAAQAVMIFLLGVGVSALFRRGDHPVLWVIQGFFYAAIGVTCVAVRRRRASRAAGTDPRGLAELSRRIRHREVPSEPGERESMRRLVDDQLSLLERNRRWLPHWLGLMGLITAALLALGVATGSLAFPLVFAVAMICLCCWVVWMRRRALDRFHYMRAALREEHERVS
ncbi:hypothetical protein [Streptomyces canus]|uniref:hypothetical protein n=1 Tax=Streptomyces canus TaxID=58343 RepID=UPI00036565AF|nr:hypothetical protein [Streptomyces canus]